MRHSLNPVQVAEGLFEGYLPERCEIRIEEHAGSIHIPPQYIFYCFYISKSSGRKVGIVAKGETLPKDHDELFYFYLRQLVLSPADIAREFSRVYFLERRARQEAWNSGQSGNIRVSGKTLLSNAEDGADSTDKLAFTEYA